MEDRDEEWQRQRRDGKYREKRENVCMCMCVCVKERNGERLWVYENAIYNGRGSGIDQSDCVL